MSASMVALFSNADDANFQAFQDNMKEWVASFNKHSAGRIDAQAPALRAVQIEAPAQLAPIDNAATSSLIPLH
jgi:hypothetical protein